MRVNLFVATCSLLAYSGVMAINHSTETADYVNLAQKIEENWEDDLAETYMDDDFDMEKDFAETFGEAEDLKIESLAKKGDNNKVDLSKGHKSCKSKTCPCLSRCDVQDEISSALSKRKSWGKPKIEKMTCDCAKQKADDGLAKTLAKHKLADAMSKSKNNTALMAALEAKVQQLLWNKDSKQECKSCEPSIKVKPVKAVKPPKPAKAPKPDKSAAILAAAKAKAAAAAAKAKAKSAKAVKPAPAPAPAPAPPQPTVQIKKPDTTKADLAKQKAAKIAAMKQKAAEAKIKAAQAKAAQKAKMAAKKLKAKASEKAAQDLKAKNDALKKEELGFEEKVGTMVKDAKQNHLDALLKTQEQVITACEKQANQAQEAQKRGQAQQANAQGGALGSMTPQQKEDIARAMTQAITADSSTAAAANAALSSAIDLATRK